MDEDWRVRVQSSVLADLGPLPEVVESNSETVWNAFQQLQQQQSAGFLTTAPSRLLDPRDEHSGAVTANSVDEVMAEARRFNRVCPVEAQWQQLGALLAAHAAGAPAAIAQPEFRRTPPLAKRIRVREQIEWAARQGLLRQVHAFFSSLSEDQWVHMGE